MIGRAAWCASLVVLLVSLFATALAAAQENRDQQATRLQEKAQKFLDDGRYTDGIDAAKRALAIREHILGTKHSDVAVSLLTLGGLYEAAGNYELSESAYQRALAIDEEVLGPNHQGTAKALTNLANLYVLTGDYSKAEPLYQRALTINEKLLGPEHMETSGTLLGLARLYTRTAAYDRAAPLYERALAIRERLLDAEHIGIAAVLNGLGTLNYYKGAYARALPLYQRALAIREKHYGGEHPETAALMTNVAMVHVTAGEYVEAEALYKRALAINEKTRGAEHPSTVDILGSLANLYSDTGAYSQAEALHRRALAIQRKTQVMKPEKTARSLNNLAATYLAMDRPEQAEPLLRQALAMWEASLGADHPKTALAAANLGDALRKMAAYDSAEPLLKRALAIREAALGAESRDTANSILSLADLYYDSGAYLKAQPLYQRSLAIYEKTMGPEYLGMARPLRSLAISHWALGESQQALALLQREQRIQTKHSERSLAAGSETRKQDYLRTLIENTFDDVSFSMSTPGTAATVLGLTSVLQHKGRVLDAMSDNVARLRRSIEPKDQEILEQLADVAGQLSSLTYGQGGNLSPEQYRDRVARLALQQEQLEADLASRSRTFSREGAPVTLASIKRAVPVKAALVEWFRYTPFDPTLKSLKARRGAPRYVAYVLKRSGDPIAVDTGEAQAIEALVRRLRVALGDPASTDVKLHAAALSAKLLAPLHNHLRGVEQILFSPDGELNLVPMAALLDESGAYLAERFDVSYLTSGRDLLRIAAEPTTLADAVIMADPDYGKRGVTLARNTPATQPQRSVDLDRSGLTFRPLASTALEAQDLRTLLNLGDASVLLRGAATEANLKRLKGPRILHIASHGFFLNDQQLTDEMIKRRGSGSAPLVTSENPLLRSGIALAGANERSSGDEDGILTALEATQLDLSGTELVVLSACDSGVGEVQNGEGVYGLRRALALAGAQTQVTSLWKVSDEATRHLMVDYYRRLLRGEGRSAALRQVQRAMLTSAAFSHPYYWASFIPIGNWNSLPPVLGPSVGN